MTEQSQNTYPSEQIEELKAIYDDYLYTVRQYERLRRDVEEISRKGNSWMNMLV